MTTSYAELYDRISRVFCLTNDITPAQKAGIESILKRRDVFISTRTGSGKSLCYQALPLASDNGITLVVCPLLSIMKEQVSCMNAVRIKSTYIGKSPEEDNLIEEGAFSIVYGSAEEIIGKDRWRRVWRSETYSRLLAIVIDEAHTL